MACCSPSSSRRRGSSSRPSCRETRCCSRRAPSPPGGPSISGSLSCCWLAAAILGDAVNYSVGRFVGPRVFAAVDTEGWLHKLLNRQHLDKAHAFFEKHGGMAVVLSRFVPIVRTFVPFVAGAASMTASTFVMLQRRRRLAVDGALRGRGLRVRQRAGDQEQLLARRRSASSASRCCRSSSNSSAHGGRRINHEDHEGVTTKDTRHSLEKPKTYSRASW